MRANITVHGLVAGQRVWAMALTVGTDEGSETIRQLVSGLLLFVNHIEKAGANVIVNAGPAKRTNERDFLVALFDQLAVTYGLNARVTR